MTTERDTHFFGFAKLLVAKLEKDGFVTPVYGVRPYTLIARAAYDLVRHAMYCDKINSAYWPGHPNYGQASDLYERETDARTEDIPDLTE